MSISQEIMSVPTRTRPWTKFYAKSARSSSRPRNWLTTSNAKKREKAMQDLRQALANEPETSYDAPRIYQGGGELMSKNPEDLSLDDRLKVLESAVARLYTEAFPEESAKLIEEGKKILAAERLAAERAVPEVLQ